MKSNLDIVREFTDSGDPAYVDTYIDDDYKMVDANGNVILDKAGLSAFGHMLYGSFEDLKYVRTELRQEGDTVILSGYWEGTHGKDLDLSAMGMGIIPASGKKIVWPEATSRFAVEGGKITEEELVGESRGIENFLAPLKTAHPSK